MHKNDAELAKLAFTISGSCFLLAVISSIAFQFAPSGTLSENSSLYLLFRLLTGIFLITLFLGILFSALHAKKHS
ncbi:hypothetical protein [Listeria costaricensis]|uniref:hypothetical protein n=1 Tax=Listeria costaricensis TaxID=2026604 RepID=UPI000C0857D4|nr:hypothetical protein [Listeria costaricensis]